MRKSFVIFASATLTGALLSSPALAQRAQRFTTELNAQEFCKTETVVWINRNTKSYHTAKSAVYGRTKRGAYMCEKDAARIGYRPVKTERATAF
jgi:hypothetical protein